MNAPCKKGMLFITLGLLCVGSMPLVGCSLLANLWNTLLPFSFSLLSHFYKIFVCVTQLTVLGDNIGSGGIVLS